MSVPTVTITVGADHYDAAWALASARARYSQAILDLQANARHLSALLSHGELHGSTVDIVTDAGSVHGLAREFGQAAATAAAAGVPTETITHIRRGGRIA